MNISIATYLKKVATNFPEEIKGFVTSYYTYHLFKVIIDKTQELLDKDISESFHKVVANMLFSQNRTRRDIPTYIAFIPTRLPPHKKRLLDKLKQLINYVCESI